MSNDIQIAIPYCAIAGNVDLIKLNNVVVVQMSANNVLSS